MHNRSKNEHDVRGKRFNAHEGVHVMQARAGTEGGAGIGSRKGRGPTQWGGPAEPSVPTRAYGTYPVRLQQTK